LEPEKQQRIWDAVLREFAAKGYRDASTNRIVEDAGIGKGMLFYYFKNKAELFRSALVYCLDYIEEEYVRRLDFSEPDFIVRFSKAVEAKMAAYLRNPLPFTFLASFHINREAVEIAPDLYSRLQEMGNKGMQALFADVDVSLFRDDVAPEHILNIIRWVMDGWSQDIIAHLEREALLDYDWESTTKKLYELFAVLRKVLYKEVQSGDSKGQ
jgi:TetR/AcrR family transcriptional regulator